MPITRPLLHLAGAALVFAAGFALHRPAPAPVLPKIAGAEPATCTDPLAMAANATLVGEVREARQDLALAKERMQANAVPVDALPGRLQASAEEWARRANDDGVLLRTPCARWDGTQSFNIHSARRGAHRRRHGDAESRLDLDERERSTLTEVYARTHARLWQSIRQVCESDADYRTAIADATELDDAGRVAACRDAVIAVSDATTLRAYHDVVAVRASGHADRGAQLDHRAGVLFALTGAPEVLFDEMTRTFGRESATRLIDHGVSCFDENAYDLRGGEPGG